jgi:tetratricopeptide (TPR) repeat protein
LLDQAIKLDRNNDTAWRVRGLAKIELENLQGAIADFNKVIQRNSNSDAAWSSRGAAKSELGDHQGAINDFTEAIKRNPKNDAAWYNRGTAKSYSGDHQGAIDDLTEAIKLSPKNDAIWSNLGVAKSKLGDHQGELGDHQRAIDDHTKAIEIKGNNYFAWDRREVANYRKGEYDGAISDFRKALQINPSFDTAIRNLEAAEIALASHENAEKPQKEKEEYHTHLKIRVKNHKDNFDALIKRRWWLFVSIITIIIIFIVLFGIFFYCYVYGGSDSALRQAIGELNFFTLWPYYMFMFMFVSLMPSVVMLRLNIQDAKRELILKEDFEGRYIVELYLERFFSAEPDHRKFAKKYISYWMHNNPSETLLRLDKKSSDQSDAAHIDIIRELIRNQKPPS